MHTSINLFVLVPNAHKHTLSNISPAISHDGFCNDWQPLAKELGIRVVPTFKILKHKKIVKEVKGAKFDDLVLAIETVRSS